MRCITSVGGIKLWLLTWLSCNLIHGHLSVKPYLIHVHCIVTVKQSFIVSQIVGGPVILS